MNLYPENQMYPFFVMRQISRRITMVKPSPKGVNSTNQLRRGLNTQILPTSSPSVWKVAAVPRRMELRNIP